MSRIDEIDCEGTDPSQTFVSLLPGMAAITCAKNLDSLISGDGCDPGMGIIQEKGADQAVVAIVTA
jgi:hypothetical protein